MGDRLVAGIYGLGVAAVAQLALSLFANSFDLSDSTWPVRIALLVVFLIAGFITFWWTGWGLGRGPAAEVVFSRELQQLVTAAGRPTTLTLKNDLKTRLSPPPPRLDETIESVLSGDTRPSWSFAEALVEACIAQANARHIGLDPTLTNIPYWRSRYDQLFTSTAVQKRSIGVAAAILVTLAAAAVFIGNTGASDRGDSDVSSASTFPSESSGRGAVPPEAESPAAARPAPGTAILGPNLSGVTPNGRLTIDKSLVTVKNLNAVRGRSDKLCCDETIWILVQPVGSTKVFPQGYCDLQNGDWACDDAQFGDAGKDIGTKYWVTAIIILNSQEDTYRAVATDGYPHDSPPLKPVRVSETITVTRV